uniref:Uncharacterized protein n=1 Tax=uncultured Acidobacteriota bacterium TaxID=171953 RepID=H5SDD9_9BACT|nr:hypothetical protein HGMM_F13B08C33 [uncultured Acidobacteriota bacterium]
MALISIFVLNAPILTIFSASSSPEVGVKASWSGPSLAALFARDERSAIPPLEGAPAVHGTVGDSAIREIAAVSANLNVSLLEEAYDSTLYVLRRFAYNELVNWSEYEEWRSRVIRAITHMDAVGFNRAIDRNLVSLTTRYQPGAGVDIYRDLLDAGMPEHIIEMFSRVSRPQALAAARGVSDMGYTNYLLSLISKLDHIIRIGTNARLRSSGAGYMLSVSTAVDFDLMCGLAILGSIATALGVASCAAALSGIALYSCLASILSIPASAIAVLVECFQ